jgi:hypothetical protein
MRLFTVLGGAKITVTPNEKLSEENCSLDYEDLPVSLPAAFSMFEEIKDDYLNKYPNEDLSNAVMEFSTKRLSGIWIKYVKPSTADTTAPPATPAPMVVDSAPAAVPKAKRPRSVTEVIVVPVPAAAAAPTPTPTPAPTQAPQKKRTQKVNA